MKDLYAKLGIEPGASNAEVAAALELKPALGACSSILLNPAKRALYDGTHATVKAIGLLRYRLGLDAGPSWFLENYPDFAPGLKSVAGAARAARASAAAPAPEPAPNQATPPQEAADTRSLNGTKWLVGIITLVGGAILIAWLFTRF